MRNARDTVARKAKGEAMRLEVPEKDLVVKIYSDGVSGLRPLVLTIHLRNSELHVSRHDTFKSATASALAFLGEGIS